MNCIFKPLTLVTVSVLILPGCSMMDRMKSGYADVASLDDGTKEIVYYSGAFTDRQGLRDKWKASADEECPNGYRITKDVEFGTYGGLDKLIGIVRCK